VRTTRALAEGVLAHATDASKAAVVVGYDGRPSSRTLAEAAAGVLLAAGVSVHWFEQATPTPVVAYAARVMATAAAIVITASHNPREDNGLKVYGSDFIQLGAAGAAEVAARREGIGPAAAIACIDFPAQSVGTASARASVVPAALFEQYLGELDASLPPRRQKNALRIAYTPLHGLGFAPVSAALKRRGFDELHAVAEQAEPDGEFPTVPFPNPELPDTLERVLALARTVQADLVLANDPDVDRLAAAAPLPDGDFYVLSGNELGVLLADFVLEHTPARPQPLLVTSIVSSPLVMKVAVAHGARAERTLTGFKWIWAAARALEQAESLRFAFGCEEALGYSIGGAVRDKDGISAAVWLAELCSTLRGETLLERLHALYRRHGAWSSAQRSLAFPGRAGARDLASCIERLSAGAPSSLLGHELQRSTDYRSGAEGRPPWLGATSLFELDYGALGRVLVRPSGTEPKLKLYADTEEPVTAAEPVAAAVQRARARAEALTAALASWLQAPASGGAA
ncbi:MAG TPA: phospho-sugar mutase, partial [Polyangiaceae bacterium]|nr:phospho-sugar mutase [Polyangiaceae bacterium]